jgi:hypothetical protein
VPLDSILATVYTVCKWWFLNTWCSWSSTHKWSSDREGMSIIFSAKDNLLGLSDPEDGGSTLVQSISN